ncbi:MAG: hypothetical protein J5843_01210 [Clostridia bacterium]|nr:hypothetical protein [Clostridia bacterium]MBO4489728.1 hypothetical protein [Lentisphaeria bacterium]
MMIRFQTIAFSAALLVLLTSCGPKTRTFDPENPPEEVLEARSVNTISSEEMRQFTDAAVHDILYSERFKSFLERFRAENGADAVPILKLTRTTNETGDSSLNTSQITDKLVESLLNSHMVKVTMAEGADIISAIGDSRDNRYDPNFKEDTVAKEGTLLAADLILIPKVVSSSMVSDGNTIVTREFNLKISSVKEGLLEWTYVKRLGFIQD